ncbi:hypothetical protein E4K10_30455 [Streptomyces sp. T1317-0309]|nr:hypothetical protein E4K10_30455 [Streptomyces sp. T1317-0309]
MCNVPFSSPSTRSGRSIEALTEHRVPAERHRLHDGHALLAGIKFGTSAGILQADPRTLHRTRTPPF